MGAPVIHIVSFPLNGHITSPLSDHACDCWCEPKPMWLRNNYGIMVYVVEHNDYTHAHRVDQLREQEAGLPESLAWINHALYDTGRYPTAEHRDIQARGFKQLPPHEGEPPCH